VTKYLKEREYYEDRYDRSTVDGARWYEDRIEKVEGSKKSRHILSNLMLYCYTGQRWKSREETIGHWMQRDRAYDDMMENTPVPKGVVCFMCNRLMELMNRFGHYGFDKDPHRIDFYFRCADCHVGMKIKDGVRERMIPWMCPKCKRRMKSESKKTKNEIRTRDWCEYCGYQKENVFDLTTPESEKTVEVDPEEERRFREDKLRFCLSNDEGFEYERSVRRMEDVKRVMDDIHAREEERKERLKDHPKGFALEEGGYSCFMCGEHLPPFDNWYDKYGIKCMSCQHALERRTVPLKYFKNHKLWYTSYQLQSEFKLHPQTIRKLVREGELKVHVIAGANGRAGYYVFPKKENYQTLLRLKVP